MGTIKENVFANAAAVWVGIIYLFCSLAVVLFPQASLAVARSWFHGFDLGEMWVNQPFRSNFWLGLISAVALTWLAVWLFARIYNYLVTRK